MSSPALATWVGEYYNLLSSNPSGLKAVYAKNSSLIWNRDGQSSVSDGPEDIAKFLANVRFSGAKADSIVDKGNSQKNVTMVSASVGGVSFCQTFVLVRTSNGYQCEADMLIATGTPADATPAPAPVAAAPAAAAPAPAPVAAAPAAAAPAPAAAPAAKSWADEEEEEVKKPAGAQQALSFAERLRMGNTSNGSAPAAPTPQRTFAKASASAPKQEVGGRSLTGVNILKEKHEKAAPATGARKPREGQGNNSRVGEGREKAPSLYIAKLPSTASEEELSKIFRKFGKVKNVHHMPDKRIAFVDMTDLASANAAIEESQKAGIKMGNTKIVVQKRLSRSEIQARESKPEAQA